MPEVKAAGLIIVRKLFAEAGPKAERRFLDSLESTDMAYYRLAVATQWIPVELAARVYRRAAEQLSPGDPAAGLQRIGRRMAEDNLRGVYRVVVKFLTVPYVVGRAGVLWRTYHNRGRARAEQRPQERTVDFFVEEYPDLPEPIRELLIGYLAALAAMTSAGQPRVTRLDDDPGCWRWTIRWQ